MKTLFALIASLSLCGTVGFAQPVVTQISNAASQSLSVPAPDVAATGVWYSLPNGSIALGSFFTIYGNNFGGNTSVCGSNYQNCGWKPYPLVTQIEGASVSIIPAQGAPVAAYIEFAAQLNGYSQINAIMPSTTPVGAGTLTVSYNGQTSPSVPITVVASSFGTFTVNESGNGPGIITDASYDVFTPFHTAKPGQAVILWGTGLGPAPDPSTEASAPPCLSGCDLRGANLSVTVWVGNQQANIAYAGRAPGFTGEDEIVFSVPNNVTTGCYVSVAVQTGPPNGTQTTSNFTTMAVDANAAPCRDADGVNMNDIAAAVTSQGSANVAAIGLFSDLWSIDVGGGTFTQWWDDSVDGLIATFDTAALNSFRGFTKAPSVNSCTVVPYLGYPPASDPGLAYVTTYLDAGPNLTIQGPIATKPVPKNANGNGYDGLVGGAPTTGDEVLEVTGFEAPFYWNSTPNGDGTFNITTIASGPYTMTGPGGANVNAITGTIDISSAAAGFVWTNASTFDNQNNTPQIPRNTPLSITWTGGDPQGFVDITLIGSTVINTLPSSTSPEPGMIVDCVLPSSAGSFNVPTYVLEALPTGAESGSPISGVVLVGPISAVTNITPVPTGLDAAYLYYHIISGYTVQWE